MSSNIMNDGANSEAGSQGLLRGLWNRMMAQLSPMANPREDHAGSRSGGSRARDHNNSTRDRHSQPRVSQQRRVRSPQQRHVLPADHDFTDIDRRMRQLVQDLDQVDPVMIERLQQREEPLTSRAAFLQQAELDTEDAEQLMQAEDEALFHVMHMRQNFEYALRDLVGRVNRLDADVAHTPGNRVPLMSLTNKRALTVSDTDDEGNAHCEICHEEKKTGDEVVTIWRRRWKGGRHCFKPHAREDRHRHSRFQTLIRMIRLAAIVIFVEHELRLQLALILFINTP